MPFEVPRAVQPVPLIEVVPGRIWQGSSVGASYWTVQTAEYSKLGIRSVICPAHNVRLAYDEELAALILPIDDHDTVSPHIFDLAVQFHRVWSTSLVHCAAGLNRSVAFAAALALTEGQSLDESYRKMGNEPTRELREAIKEWRRSHGFA